MILIYFQNITDYCRASDMEKRRDILFLSFVILQTFYLAPEALNFVRMYCTGEASSFMKLLENSPIGRVSIRLEQCKT